MIKLPFISIYRLGKLCFLMAAMLFAHQSSAQIVTNWPDFLNNNSGGVATINESISLTGCTSISFSMEYLTDEYAGGGTNNLESADECNFGDPCYGDPLNPAQGDCEFCWDFLIFEFEVNGAFEFGDFIGTSNLVTSNTYLWESGCIDPNDTYDLELNASSQTWQGTEDIDITNMTILCWQGVAETDVTIDPSDELCEGDNLNLSVTSDFVDAEWYFDGSNIGTGTDINVNGVTTASSGTYIVETTDDNGCSSSVEFDVLVEEIPMSCPVVSTIEACLNTAGFAEIDLTQYDAEVNCFGSDDVLWFQNQFDIPDSPIISPDTYESDGSDLYAVVWNGTCYSSEQLVFIDTGSGIDPEIEINPSTICEGEALLFDVTTQPACVGCTYTWDGPPGSGISGDETPSSMFPFFGATPAQSGTWIVTVTDGTGCSGSTSTDVVVNPEPTGNISGGGDLCPGFCTDATNELTLDLSGGVAPYDVELEISIGVLNVPLTLPAFLPNGTISLCIDPSSFLPSLSDFDGDGVNDLVIPNIALDFSISLASLTDANGCEGSGMGTINYTINPIPSANDPGGPYEQCASGIFDLTSYNGNINGTDMIVWYLDMDLTMPISNPGAYSPAISPTTVYAVVDNGTCTSLPVSLELVEISTPTLDPIDDVTVCDFYEFLQPSGMNLGINFFYEDASGGTFLPGDVTMTGGNYILTAGDDPACLATEDFELTILNQPNIVFPTTELSGCGEIQLPMIDVLNFDVSTGVVGYFEGPDQGGTMYMEGATIDQASGLSSIYVYVGSADCFEELQIDLLFTSAIEYILPPYPTDACGDLELLPIGGATAGVAYFTEPDGNGDQYTVGEILPAPGSYTLYLFDPTIDQTCVINSNESFTITLEEQTIIDAIDDMIVCESDGFVLPTITGTFLTGNEGYSTATAGGGTMYMPGDTIFTSSTIFIYNTSISCPATEVVFMVEVVPAPFAGTDQDLNTCPGPVIDLFDFLSANADLGGVFTPTASNVVLTGPDNSMWDTSTGDENIPYLFNYTVSDPMGVCDDASVEISVVLNNFVTAGVSLPDSTVCEGSMIDLFGLLVGESTGGYFLNQNNLMDTLYSGGWVADDNGGEFLYIIEAANGCTGDQASFNVNVIDEQLVTVDIPVLEVCEGNCIEMIINSNFDTALDFQLVDLDNNSEVYDLNIAVDGMQVVEICADGTLGNLNANTLSLGEAGGDFVIAFAFLQNVADCETDLSNIPNFTIELIPAFEETLIGEVCQGEGFMYQGEEYFDDVIIMGFSDCDSTTIIDIVEFPPAENFEDNTYCIGTNVTIGGNIYTEDTQVDLLLMGASANGCDSTIYIDITFDNASYNDVFKTICADEQEIINMITYDINFPMGADTLINGSVLGCDSIITVVLDFYDVAMGTEEQTICEGDTINILGVDFYSGMEQMEVILENQSAAGCDSIVEVSIDFFPTMEIDMEFEKCQGDTLLVDGFEITDANLNGFYTLASTGTDCPTIVNYTTDLFLASMIEIDTSICQGESIVINGITFSEDYTFDQSSILTANGCDSTVTISVNIESASVTAMSELIASNTFQINYQGTEITDPVWNSNLGTLSCETCDSPSINIDEDTEVYFSGLTESGCLVTDTLFLSFLPEPVFVGIYTPNIFSPEDDNLNKIYTVFGTGGFTISEMAIFDRWGNEVFVARDFLPNEGNVGWDGRINGNKAEVGVYVGRILYIEQDGTEGVEYFDLTLIR